MTRQITGQWLMAVMACAIMGAAQAKLPSPPVDTAKAEEAKAKAAAAAKLEAEQLAKAQDRAVDRYKKEKAKDAAPAPVKTSTVASGAPKK